MKKKKFDGRVPSVCVCLAACLLCVCVSVCVRLSVHFPSDTGDVRALPPAKSLKI